MSLHGSVRRRRPAALHRAMGLLGLGACFCLLLPAAQAQAQFDDTAFVPTTLVPEDDLRRIVVLPVLDMSGTRNDLARIATLLLADAFGRYPRFEVLSGASLVARIEAAADYREKLAWAREFARVGRGEYERIRLAEAVEHLRLATSTLRAVHHDLVQPREVAQTLLTLAKAHLELGHEAPAQLAFQALLSVEPSLDLPRERFSVAVLALFERARYYASQNSSSGLDMDKAVSVGRLVEADYVLTGHLRPRPDSDKLALAVWIYAVERPLPIAPEQRVPADAPEGLADEVDRLGSRLAACIPNTTYLAWQQDPARHRRSLWADTSFVHATFLQHPLQQAFPNLGVSAGLAWTPLRHLLLAGRILFSTSRNNSPYDDLLTQVQDLRFLLGGGILAQSKHFGLHTFTGVELAFPFAFRWTREADCKWLRPPPGSCDRQVHEHDPGFAFGVHGGLGAHWAVAPPLLLRARLGASYYVLPVTGNELNLPLDWELGLGYRF